MLYSNNLFLSRLTSARSTTLVKVKYQQIIKAVGKPPFMHTIAMPLVGDKAAAAHEEWYLLARN